MLEFLWEKFQSFSGITFLPLRTQKLFLFSMYLQMMLLILYKFHRVIQSGKNFDIEKWRKFPIQSLWEKFPMQSQWEISKARKSKFKAEKIDARGNFSMTTTSYALFSTIASPYPCREANLEESGILQDIFSHFSPITFYSLWMQKLF